MYIYINRKLYNTMFNLSIYVYTHDLQNYNYLIIKKRKKKLYQNVYITIFRTDASTKNDLSIQF